MKSLSHQEEHEVREEKQNTFIGIYLARKLK